MIQISIVTAAENKELYPKRPVEWTDDLSIETDDERGFILLKDLARALKPYLDCDKDPS